MKYLSLASFFVAVAVTTVTSQAVTYTFDSSVPTSGSNFATSVPAAQDGWSINDASSEVSFLRQGTGGAGDQDVALGGFQSSPTGTLVSLDHDVGLPFAGSSFSVDFSLINRWSLNPDPNGFPFFPEDDTFTFGFSTLLTIAFAPTALENTREVLHNNVSSGMGFLASDYDTPIPYRLEVSFTASGLDLLYTGKVTSLSDASFFTFGSSLANQAGATFDKISVGFDVADTSAANAGSNIILFDNLTVVPEPGAPLLGLIALGLLGSRRKR